MENTTETTNTKSTWLAIQDEYEGEAPLYFPIEDHERFANYMKSNAERGQEYRIKIEELTPEQVGMMATDI